ncbi:MAG: hypothetical protein ACRDL0_09380 [Thermoleophilaceae bacterium]
MKIRITGTGAECDRLVARLAQILQLHQVSDFYPNRAPSALGRVYLDVDLTQPAAVRATTTRTHDSGADCRRPGGARQ